jgi:hypothetical protein
LFQLLTLSLEMATQAPIMAVEFGLVAKAVTVALHLFPATPLLAVTLGNGVEAEAAAARL